MAGARQGVDVSKFEAALNRLKEERLAVIGRRLDIDKDAALKASDYGHWRQLRSQTLLEVGQLGRAIELLERVQCGELVEVDMPETVVRRNMEPRQTALIRKVQPTGGRA
jgi:hypothetical protein